MKQSYDVTILWRNKMNTYDVKHAKINTNMVVLCVARNEIKTVEPEAFLWRHRLRGEARYGTHIRLGQKTAVRCRLYPTPLWSRCTRTSATMCKDSTQTSCV